MQATTKTLVPAPATPSHAPSTSSSKVIPLGLDVLKHIGGGAPRNVW